MTEAFRRNQPAPISDDALNSLRQIWHTQIATSGAESGAG